MKRIANRQKVETLFILGAGSSKALTEVKTRRKQYHEKTTPIDRDFLMLLDYFKHNQGWQKESWDELVKNWLGADELQSRGLEEAVIRRVADYDMISALYPDKSRRKCKNEQYLNHLTHLIADYLIKCRSNNSGDTKRFINKVFPDQDVAEFQNRIITFNYDIIIDRPLIERGLAKKKIYFDRIASRREDGTRRDSNDRFPHPLLLKLHGSVNWRCERRYFDNIVAGSVNEQDRIPIWSVDTRCPSPSDDESLLIIPPVPNKPITRASIFRMLWTKAMEYLHEARRIVIVGYSCPQTDALARSVFTQFRNMNVKDIYIVDPSSDALFKYHSLFRSRVRNNVNWHYCEGFHQYIKNEC